MLQGPRPSLPAPVVLSNTASSPTQQQRLPFTSISATTPHVPVTDRPATPLARIYGMQRRRAPRAADKTTTTGIIIDDDNPDENAEDHHSIDALAWPPGYSAEDEAALTRFHDGALTDGREDDPFDLPPLEGIMASIFGQPHKRRPRGIPDPAIARRRPLLYAAAASVSQREGPPPPSLNTNGGGGGGGSKAKQNGAAKKHAPASVELRLCVDCANEPALEAARALCAHLTMLRRRRAAAGAAEALSVGPLLDAPG